MEHNAPYKFGYIICIMAIAVSVFIYREFARGIAAKVNVAMRLLAYPHTTLYWKYMKCDKFVIN